ncbi:dTDP-4-dehydrorhamnose reductase [Desulfosarcina cetonica]|uniref:dTDP-4-dehydrorhamnose reductase n=1 Tax=Desulfosarcina cetonica TaxID=90730 RepID=UPI0006D13D84|nr:dTDP-4-dehydrorhamnose reductase [Desulfosarcina cetonica]VTR64126.1 dTDP-4-dehydrorhamnose reductase [Desulfosarcina cetonica]
MNVLIVGKNGQLGTTLMKTAPKSVAIRGVDLPAFDVTDANVVMTVVASEKPDVIINASAYTAVDRAEEEAELAYRINATGPQNLARAAAKTGARLIHVSTDYVFDGTACTPYAPDAVCNPIGVYGKSKHQGEQNILNELDAVVIIRTAWLYSQFGNNFVLTILRLLKEKTELGIVADQIGGPTWATTLAHAIWRTVARPDLKGVFHWTDAGVASWYDFAVAIAEEALARQLIEKPIPIRPITTADYPTLAARPAYSVLDCTASWRSLGLAPVHWRVALRQMLDGLIKSTR